MSSSDRQRIERVPGSRRAKLTPAPGATAEPTPADDEVPDTPAEASGVSSSGPNDERLRRDVPPHY
ncbi:hypothetical protein [Microbacterium cremeum]|uniref:hypothetical protein n=1 Tax=Microbacterium cremeum TaxID=2782169 RepID=UPI001888780F|nr:hypothetical protein [Microbacterium cremeum]